MTWTNDLTSGRCVNCDNCFQDQSCFDNLWSHWQCIWHISKCKSTNSWTYSTCQQILPNDFYTLGILEKGSQAGNFLAATLGRFWTGGSTYFGPFCVPIYVPNTNFCGRHDKLYSYAHESMSHTHITIHIISRLSGTNMKLWWCRQRHRFASSTLSAGDG